MNDFKGFEYYKAEKPKKKKKNEKICKKFKRYC